MQGYTSPRDDRAHPNSRSRLMLAVAFALVASLAAPSTHAAAKKPASMKKLAVVCTVGARTAARTVGACAFGAPVAVGKVILLPKACRLPLDGGFVDRHTIEVRDAKTGAKRGQSSLRPKRATKTTPLPAVGQVIGGAFPLYVFSGGIAAVDPTTRKADLVLESSGTLAAAAQYGEVLAVVDTIGASNTFPKGALEWTVIDFGSSEMLGQQRIAGTGLDAVGLGKEKGKLVAWMRRRAKGKNIEIYAAVRGKNGKAVSKDGNLRAGVRAAGKASASSAVIKPGAMCPISLGVLPVVVARPMLSVRGSTVSQSATAAHHLGQVSGSKYRCVAMTRADRNGKAWALLHDGKRGRLQDVMCKRAAAKASKAAPAKARKKRDKKRDKKSTK